MKKGYSGMIFLTLFLLPFSVFAEEVSYYETIKTPKVHIARKGDTLWDMSRKYFNNPFKWQDIWDKNRFIINPSLIYPGDNILIPGFFEEIEIKKESLTKVEPEISKGEAEAHAEKKPEIDEEKIPLLQEIALPPPPPEKIPLTTIQNLATSGYIILKEKEVGIIFDSPESRTIFGEGDTVYIDAGEKSGIKAGNSFTIYKPIKSVNHPITGKEIGILIEEVGELEIKKVQGDNSIADISVSYNVIEVGDRLKEKEDITVPLIDPAAKAEAKDITGYIIDIKNNKYTAGTGDIVYVDVGREAGVSAGDRFNIFKSEEKIKNKDKQKDAMELPKITIGSLQVIAARENTSTAIITESKREIAAGQMIEYEKQ